MMRRVDIWFNGQQAAAYIGKSDEWLRRKVNGGQLRYSIDPSNGRKIYSKTVLDRFVRPISVENYLKSKSYEKDNQLFHGILNVRGAARR